MSWAVTAVTAQAPWAAERGERGQVGGQTGRAAGVGPGDGEHHRRGHRSAGLPRAARRRPLPGRAARITAPITATPCAPAPGQRPAVAHVDAAEREHRDRRARRRRSPAAAGPWPGLLAVAAYGERVTYATPSPAAPATSLGTWHDRPTRPVPPSRGAGRAARCSPCGGRSASRERDDRAARGAATRSGDERRAALAGLQVVLAHDRRASQPRRRRRRRTVSTRSRPSGSCGGR